MSETAILRPSRPVAAPMMEAAGAGKRSKKRPHTNTQRPLEDLRNNFVNERQLRHVFGEEPVTIGRTASNENVRIVKHREVPRHARQCC